MVPTSQVGGWPAWLVLGLVALSLALAVSHAVRPSHRTLVAAVVTMAACFLGGLFGTAVGLARSFGSVASIDPALKSTVLARGISEAMNCTAFALGGTLLWSVPFVVGEVRRRRSGRPGAATPATGGPPR
ncbi:MAG: MotA/TolQ/ExbB proton channel family protein [Deltaproteobacteria bacterium]|nr:MotA/TolQ/ExbB proton channel family protein [Deltaproteobacteria bacterium]